MAINMRTEKSIYFYQCLRYRKCRCTPVIIIELLFNFIFIIVLTPRLYLYVCVSLSLQYALTYEVQEATEINSLMRANTAITRMMTTYCRYCIINLNIISKRNRW